MGDLRVYLEAMRGGAPDGQAHLDAYLQGATRRLGKLRAVLRRLSVAYDGALRQEATQRPVKGRDGIIVGPKFLALTDGQRDWILAHEIGHWVSGKVGTASWMKAAGKLGIDPWDTMSLPWGQFNMEEAFAESFAVAMLGHDHRWPEWQQLALATGARAGL